MTKLKYKKFGGKTYSRHPQYSHTKAEATKRAKAIRNRELNYLARIVKEEGVWWIYLGGR
jgi:hypothetical protein